MGIILRSQANAVFQEIQKVGLRPGEFEWNSDNSRFDHSDTVSKLVHKPSKSYYLFDFSEKYAVSFFNPTEECATRGRKDVVDWPGRIDHLRNWLILLKHEVDTPDLWAVVAEESHLAVGVTAEHTQNLPFTLPERKRLAGCLREVEMHIISTNNFDKGDLDFLHQRITYLQEASERMGKKDWINISVGVLTNIVIGLALSPDSARELFRFGSKVLAWIIGGKVLLP